MAPVTFLTYPAGDLGCADRLGFDIFPQPIHFGGSISPSSPKGPLSQGDIYRSATFALGHLLQNGPGIVFDDHVNSMTHGTIYEMCTLIHTLALGVAEITPHRLCRVLCGTPAPQGSLSISYAHLG